MFIVHHTSRPMSSALKLQKSSETAIVGVQRVPIVQFTMIIAVGLRDTGQKGLGLHHNVHFVSQNKQVRYI